MGKKRNFKREDRKKEGRRNNEHEFYKVKIK